MRDVNMPSIRSIERSIDVMESFSLKNQPLTIEEIAAITKLPKSTVYRILCTLEKRELILFNEKTLQYQPGVRLLELGLRYGSFFDVKRQGEDILSELYLKTKQTVLMAVHAGERISYIYRRENEEGLKVSSGVGERHYLYGVLGPILLAYLPERQIDQILSQPIPKRTPFTLLDPENIKARLETIRKDAFFFEKDETHVGATGFGVPIFNSVGEVIAAAGIIMPTFHFTEEKLVQYRELLLEASKQISERMGYKPKL
ncbi:IclR family transcriptional regulator [Neobacillus sp. Marseille-QA0830]